MSKVVKTILIVIIVIAILFWIIKWFILPMMIQIKARNAFESVDLITAFNEKFTCYEGTQEGSSIKILVNTISHSNSSSDKMVAINFKGTTYSNSNVSSVSSLITASNTYNVTIKYDSEGYVETISIS